MFLWVDECELFSFFVLDSYHVDGEPFSEAHVTVPSRELLPKILVAVDGLALTDLGYWLSVVCTEELDLIASSQIGDVSSERFCDEWQYSVSKGDTVTTDTTAYKLPIFFRLLIIIKMIERNIRTLLPDDVACCDVMNKCVAVHSYDQLVLKRKQVNLRFVVELFSPIQ